MLKPNVVIMAWIIAFIAFADELTWDLPTEDINGNYIDSAVLYSKLYWGYTNSEWNDAGTVTSPVILDGIPAGCYHLALTAVRTDTSPELESAGSESVYYCTPTDLPPNPPTNVGAD